MAWQLTQCLWRDRQQLDAYLRDSWEPFAVSETDAECQWRLNFRQIGRSKNRHFVRLPV